ncbi:MAG: DEAD/DEAH box helicase [Methylococcaceae bacterium]
MSASNSEPLSSSFFLLDKRIQRWIWDSGWDELKDIQEQSIPLILAARKDVILAAATASGKTEAAFLPILTRMLQEPKMGCVLYISPLKALINDQFGRLELLCEKLEIPVTPWHGDISATKKKKFLQSQKGVVLITPESLEAMLMLRCHQIPSIFENLRYIIIDELHAFMGSERGKQLQSQMHRLDVALKRTTPRIALSATLGDMEKAGEFLRPKSPVMAEIVESKSDARELKISIKGYEGDQLEYAFPLIAEDLFQKVRGSNNLIFPNSRQKVEFLADKLREQSEKQRVENEFFPHHGNLSKEIREETEAALKSKKPVTAICTTTLELGIDIGDVKTVGQIGCSPSVASLRQRLGRSGRRKGESAILRGYVIEDEIDADSPVWVRLREGTIQFIAQISLLFQRWYEPPRIKNLHLSTLVQQLLSLIAQYQGITAANAWQILCVGGLFDNLDKQDFVLLLKALGRKEKEILMQTPNGLLLLGSDGEKLVNNYKFYASFKNDEEYRIVHEHKTLGTLPITYKVEVDDCIIFAGKRWLVRHIQHDNAEIKRIDVVKAPDGMLPTFDGGDGFLIDDKVRQEMYQILLSTKQYPFLDETAARFLNEARQEFQLMGLNQHPQTILDCGDDKVFLFTWRGSQVTRTICLMLEMNDIQARGDFYLEIKTSPQELFGIFKKLLESPPDALSLVVNIPNNKQQEKWDHLLPEPLLSKNYASAMLDVDGAIETLKGIFTLYSF